LGATLPAAELDRRYLVDGLVCRAVKERGEEQALVERRHLLVDGEQDSVVGGTSRKTFGDSFSHDEERERN
jgi:hypothetical protein